MEDDDKMTITEEGVAEAITILSRDGFLTAMTDDDDFSDLATLEKACKKYVEASVAKGSKRSNMECRDAILIGFFQAWVGQQLKFLVN
jgi:hypothetical protein